MSDIIIMNERKFFFLFAVESVSKTGLLTTEKSGTKNVSTALWFVNIKNTSNKSPLHNY